MSEMIPHDDEWRELLASWKDEPREEALERLSEHWDEVSRHESYVVQPAVPDKPNQRNRVGWIVALVACVLVSVLAWHLGTLREAPQRPQLANEEKQPTEERSPELPQMPAAKLNPPNQYQLAVASMLMDQRRKRLRQPKEDLVSTLREAIERELTFEEAARRLGLSPKNIRGTVLRLLPDLEAKEKRFLLNVAESVDGIEFRKLLVDLQNDSELRELAYEKLVQRTSVVMVGRMLIREGDPERQSLLLRRLIESNSHAGVGIYLNFVRNRQTRGVALATLRKIKSPPVELLQAFFDSPQYAERLAAGRALGEILDEESTRNMIRLVVAGKYRAQALAALVASRHSDATQFIARARGDQRLGPSVVSVMFQMRQLH